MELNLSYIVSFRSECFFFGFFFVFEATIQIQIWCIFSPFCSKVWFDNDFIWVSVIACISVHLTDLGGCYVRCVPSRGYSPVSQKETDLEEAKKKNKTEKEPAQVITRDLCVLVWLSGVWAFINFPTEIRIYWRGWWISYRSSSSNITRNHSSS